MTFQEMALRMYPFWVVGILIIFIVYFTKYRNLLRVEWKSIKKWLLFLCAITIYRILIFKIFKNNHILHNTTSGVSIVPWQVSLMVFWEDAVHCLPLVIFTLMLGKNKLWKRVISRASIVCMMFLFGLGHIYQGYLAALMISLYIPYTFKKGQEIGFGTIMIAHTLYDLATLLTIKTFLG